MKTAGLIGGIAPESTIEYYRSLVREYQVRVGDGSYPPILINSIDLTRMLRLVGDGELAALTDYLAGEVLKLAKAGADFAALASNTPHIVFDELRQRSPVPLVSIVEAACDAAAASGLKRVGLFGTRSTMRARFYPEVFSARGITVVAPGPEDQEYIHARYMNELVKGRFLSETQKQILAIASRMQENDRVEAIVLAGTELPLLLRDPSSASVPLLDTMAIHVRKIVAEIVA